MVGPNAKLSQTSTLITSHASVDIDLTVFPGNTDGIVVTCFQLFVVGCWPVQNVQMFWGYSFGINSKWGGLFKTELITITENIIAKTVGL